MLKTYAIMPVGKKDKKCPNGTQKSPVRQHRGFFIPFWQGGLCPRLTTAYLSLPNHLQMQQATTLAKTESKKDKNESNWHTPFLHRSRGGSLLIISCSHMYNNSKVNIQKRIFILVKVFYQIQPPSSVIICPVRYSFPSERDKAREATSSGAPNRPAGISSARAARSSSEKQ